MRVSRHRQGGGGKGVPSHRARTPSKGRPISRRHYGVRPSRDASKGSTFAETPAGDTQLSRRSPVGEHHAETRSGTLHAMPRPRCRPAKCETSSGGARNFAGDAPDTIRGKPDGIDTAVGLCETVIIGAIIGTLLFFRFLYRSNFINPHKMGASSNQENEKSYCQ